MTLKEKFLEIAKDGTTLTFENEAEQCEKIADKFAIEFGRWIIQNQEIENTSSWSEDTANYYLKEFKKEKGL